ncbi:hypothetical protein ACFU7Y_36360 [Kitasatospora sp. NPDC057542]|uniref:hypothetical protein n=1 Tax=Kitasatospora sp. NPDC057542 TaxID=3346162 RepID=UPI0036CCC5C3
MPSFLDKLSRLLRAALPERPNQRHLAALRLAAPRQPGAEMLSATSSPAPALPGPGQYRVAVLLNVALGPEGRMVNFDGFQDGHELAVASPAEGSPLLILTVTAQDLLSAAGRAFDIGNRQDTDDKGVEWPCDLRSVSVGDVVHITSPSGHWYYLAVARRGFTHIDPPLRKSIVALVGSSATSRI